MENAKILIVDDETVSEESKQGFLHSIKIPEKYVIFAHNYEEAKNIIQNRDDIVFCLLDCRIPKNGQPRDYTLDPKDPNFVYYGMRLIPILQDIPIYIYSAYAEESFLKREITRHPQVVGGAQKPFSDTDKLNLQRNHLEKVHAIETFEENKEVLHFDYSFLQQKDKNYICDRARKIKKVRRRATQDIIDIGKYLIEVKNKLEHGQFENWLKVEFTWSGGTAKRFMAVAREFKSINLIDIESFPASALYVLAAPITPKEAVEEAIARAKQGEAISEKKAQELRNKYLDRSNQKKSDSSNVDVEEEETLADSLKTAETYKQEEITNETSKVKSIDIKEKIIIEDGEVSLPSQNKVERYDDSPKRQIHQIINIQPNIKNHFWQFENHRLFCGEPTSNLFLERLPEEIAFQFRFPPNNDETLAPKIINADSSLSLCSIYKDINLKTIEIIVKAANFELAPVQEIVVFSYIFDISILKLAMSMDCYCWVAEPNLTLCKQILDYWRSKGDVKRL